MAVMTIPISLSRFIDSSCIEELIHTAATEENCDVEISLNMQGETFEISGLTVQMNNNNNNNNNNNKLNVFLTVHHELTIH